jgi:L-alanine-DL-glutamate epimerase-like enolase superfamily enzyme
MRIASMEAIPVNIAYRHAEVSSRVRWGGVSSFVVKLTADTGLVGWGEASVGADATLVEAALRGMRPFVPGRSPWHGEAIARDVYRAGLWNHRVQTNEGLGSDAGAYRVIASGVADVVCFSSYWVGTLRRFHVLASLACLLGIGACKLTQGELGIAAASAHHLLLPLPNAAEGAHQTAAIMADDLLAAPLPIATGLSWGMPDAPGLGVEADEAKLARFAADYGRDGKLLPYGA